MRHITGGPSSSSEIIILRYKIHGEIIRMCMGIFTTPLTNLKNTVHFSIKIPDLLQCIACYLTAYHD